MMIKILFVSPFILCGIWLTRAQMEFVMYYRQKVDPSFTPITYGFSFNKWLKLYKIIMGKVVIDTKLSELSATIRRRFLIMVLVWLITNLFIILAVINGY